MFFVLFVFACVCVSVELLQKWSTDFTESEESINLWRWAMQSRIRIPVIFPLPSPLQNRALDLLAFLIQSPAAFHET